MAWAKPGTSGIVSGVPSLCMLDVSIMSIICMAQYYQIHFVRVAVLSYTCLVSLLSGEDKITLVNSESLVLVYRLLQKTMATIIIFFRCIMKGCFLICNMVPKLLDKLLLLAQ